MIHFNSSCGWFLLSPITHLFGWYCPRVAFFSFLFLSLLFLFKWPCSNLMMSSIMKAGIAEEGRGNCSEVVRNHWKKWLAERTVWTRESCSFQNSSRHDFPVAMQLISEKKTNGLWLSLMGRVLARVDQALDKLHSGGGAGRMTKNPSSVSHWL